MKDSYLFQYTMRQLITQRQDRAFKSLVRRGYGSNVNSDHMLQIKFMSTYFEIALMLTHWGRLTHICVSKLTIIGSDNGLSPCRRHAIIWTNAGILLIRTLGTNFSEILGEIHSFSFSKMHLKMSSANWRLFGLGLNELIPQNNIDDKPTSVQVISWCHQVVHFDWGLCRHMAPLSHIKLSPKSWPDYRHVLCLIP